VDAAPLWRPLFSFDGFALVVPGALARLT